MTTPKIIVQEISALTGDLIASGICVDQNFPSLTLAPGGITEIGFANLQELAITLKNIAYKESYEVMREKRSYNIKLIDGGLLQMLYRFSGDALTSHRLAFFPSPDLLDYQNNSDVYEDDVLYGDIVMKNVVTVPIRFDFDQSTFQEVIHPMSHLTIGQYKNCRIPVSAPLTPFHFVSFILSAFYNTPFRSFVGELQRKSERFGRTIQGAELSSIYINACAPT